MAKIDKQIKYWQESGKDNFELARVLFKTKHYDACLFFCHLAIEKIIKGLVAIKLQKTPPKIHDLPRLANLAGLTVTEKQLADLKTITTFNIAGRYEEEKYNFYKLCTKDFTQKNLLICQKIFLWLKKQYPKK